MYHFNGFIDDRSAFLKNRVKQKVIVLCTHKIMSDNIFSLENFGIFTI